MAKASKGNKKKSSEEEWTPKKNDKGLIMNWSCKSRDGRELKYYVDGGCCDDLEPKNVRLKFPQFLLYMPGTFSSALSNARKSRNDTVRNRSKKNCKCSRTADRTADRPTRLSI
jgi:hypothetical protein